MQVRMLTGLSGIDYSLSSGDLHECSEAEAGRLIAAGFAEAIAPETPVETVKKHGKSLKEKATALFGKKEQRG